VRFISAKPSSKSSRTGGRSEWFLVGFTAALSFAIIGSIQSPAVGLT
jgi:hypothetical protein